MATVRTVPHVTGTFLRHVGIENHADRPIEDAGKAVRRDAGTTTHAQMITDEMTRLNFDDRHESTC